MKVSTEWLQEYFPNETLDANEVANALELGAVEVSSVKSYKEGLSKLVVGEVIKVDRHPDADHLHICQVNVGTEVLQIVCGAPNVVEGVKVIVALPGAWIGNHTKIKKSKMRGVASNGMLCGISELGLSEKIVPDKNADGLYILPQNSEPGESVFPILGFDDPVIETDLTPNRGDMNSMNGTAWEVGALYGLTPDFKKTDTQFADKNIKITPELQTDLISNVVTQVIKNISVDYSPLWLQKRLWNAGIKSTNLIEDCLNYAMLVYGQPIDAFALSDLNNKFVIKKLSEKTKINLNQSDYQLNVDDIVISNEQEILSIGGIKKVNDEFKLNNTQDIVLVAGVFDSASIRKTAHRLNLHTESSMRYERGVDVNLVNEAVTYASYLIHSLSPNSQVSMPNQVNYKKKQDVLIELNIHHVNKLLGIDLTKHDIQKIFDRLHFEYKDLDESSMIVNISSRRWDINIEADLIEEIIRLYGYDKLPSKTSQLVNKQGHLNKVDNFLFQSRKILVALGMNQAISYSLTSFEKAQQFCLEDPALIKVNDPLNSERTTMRGNLISGLLDDIAYNYAHGQNDICLFETGKVFVKNVDKPIERNRIAVAITGELNKKSWANNSEKIDFFTLKGILSSYLSQLNVDLASINYVSTDKYEELHPGRTAEIYVNKQLIGIIGQVHPNIAKQYKIPLTYVFEINADILLNFVDFKQTFNEIVKYPSVSRDLAILVDNNITNQEILDCIRERGGKRLVAINLFDLYTGEKIPDGKKSLAYNLIFQDANNTLTEEKVDKLVEKITVKLTESVNAVIR